MVFVFAYYPYKIQLLHYFTKTAILLKYTQIHYKPQLFCWIKIFQDLKNNISQKITIIVYVNQLLLLTLQEKHVWDSESSNN